MKSQAERSAGRINLATGALEAGMVVEWDIFSGDELLVRRGARLTESLIASLKRRGIRTVEIAPRAEAAPGPEQPRYGNNVQNSLKQMIESTAQIYKCHEVHSPFPADELEASAFELESAFGQVEQGGQPDVGVFRDLAGQLISRYADSTRWPVKIHHPGEGPARQFTAMLNTALLFLMAAWDRAPDRRELQDLLVAVMLRDMGLAQLPASEREEPAWGIEPGIGYRRHPGLSEEMLAAAGGGPLMCQICRSHHERMDSSGYPDGRDASGLDFFTRLTAVCDSYERITSNRLRQHKTSFNRAVDLILQSCGTAFDSDAVHSFVRRIGRYPVGSFVLLSSGEVAVVVETNPAAVLCPVVSRITDTRLEQRNMPERLDLNVVHEVGITSSIGGQYVV